MGANFYYIYAMPKKVAYSLADVAKGLTPPRLYVCAVINFHTNDNQMRVAPCGGAFRGVLR